MPGQHVLGAALTSEFPTRPPATGSSWDPRAGVPDSLSAWMRRAPGARGQLWSEGRAPPQTGPDTGGSGPEESSRRVLAWTRARHGVQPCVGWGEALNRGRSRSRGPPTSLLDFWDVRSRTSSLEMSESSEQLSWRRGRSSAGAEAEQGQ